MSSSAWLILLVVGPGGGLVVEGAGLEAAVQDADQAVAELAQGGVVADAAGAQGVVVGPRAGGGTQRGERLGGARSRARTHGPVGTSAHPPAAATGSTYTRPGSSH